MLRLTFFVTFFLLALGCYQHDEDNMKLLKEECNLLMQAWSEHENAYLTGDAAQVEYSVLDFLSQQIGTNGGAVLKSSSQRSPFYLNNNQHFGDGDVVFFVRLSSGHERYSDGPFYGKIGYRGYEFFNKSKLEGETFIYADDGQVHTLIGHEIDD